MTVLKENVIIALQKRIQQEEASSRLYRSMSNWLTIKGFIGAGKLFLKYSNEELVHAQIAYQYLLDLDVLPVTPALEEPKTNYLSFKEILVAAYEHEIVVTDECNSLAILADTNKDYMTLRLAQWYLNEQTEELSKTKTWLDRIDAFGNGQVASRLLDNEMGELAEG